MNMLVEYLEEYHNPGGNAIQHTWIDTILRETDWTREKDPEKKLRCSACGFVKPESIENEIVHIHHLIPLKEIEETGTIVELNKILELVIPLCPTCHSIAHSQTETLSVDEIKKLRIKRS